MLSRLQGAPMAATVGAAAARLARNRPLAPDAALALTMLGAPAFFDPQQLWEKGFAAQGPPMPSAEEVWATFGQLNVTAPAAEGLLTMPLSFGAASAAGGTQEQPGVEPAAPAPPGEVQRAATDEAPAAQHSRSAAPPGALGVESPAAGAPNDNLEAIYETWGRESSWVSLPAGLWEEADWCLLPSPNRACQPESPPIFLPATPGPGWWWDDCPALLPHSLQEADPIPGVPVVGAAAAAALLAAAPNGSPVTSQPAAARSNKRRRVDHSTTASSTAPPSPAGPRASLPMVSYMELEALRAGCASVDPLELLSDCSLREMASPGPLGGGSA